MSRSESLAPPSGAVTFLFTDVEGSTKLWERNPEQMRSALQSHDEILRDNIAGTGGLVFSTSGDAFAAAFQSPDEAIGAATGAQRDLHGHGWPEDASLRVRMGVHTGVAQQRDNDYFGPTLNRAARLMSAAHGGQTVVSTATQSLLSDVPMLDMGEHRLKDLSQPEHVWQLIIEGLASEFPPLRTLNAVPTNLPMELASFIGRHDDLEQLMKALADNRLVSMTGVGGVGKTRLSLHVAADASHHYPQGLWFVELAPVRVDDAVPYQFLETLGLEAEPGRRPIQTVAKSVGEGSVLLVVDNCEHLVGAAADAIGQLLAACPNLKVLASSRRALGIRGERVWQIQPLDTSGPGSAAVQLFLDRAAAARNDSGLTERIDVITDICARLDGVPLAIELAAARIRSMTPEDIASRLDERFRLLKGSGSAGDERHKTLLSTIEWSYQLLGEGQQLLLQRLSVFAAPFTLEAAEKVCSDERLDELDVVDLLDGLVDQSMLVADIKGATTRYRMLETIREFAVRELGDELRALRDRHAEYHAEWVGSLSDRLRTTDEPAALRELEAGWSNLRAAATHATGDLRLLARLLGPALFDAMWRSRFELGEWANVGLTVADAEGADDDTRAVLLGCSATILALAGDTERAVALASELVAHCEQTKTMMPFDVGPPVVSSTVMAGDFELAGRVQDLCEQAVAKGAEPHIRAMTAVMRAVIATYSGQPEIAKQAIIHANDDWAPHDLGPSWRAIFGWMSAVNSDAPRAEVVKQMERVVEQASLVKLVYLHAIFSQHLSSVRAELGDLTQPMRDAADNLERLIASHNLGLVPPAVRRAAVLLIKAGEHEPAARLLGWVDSMPQIASATFDLAAEMEVLVPQMHEALGADASGATAAGAGLSTEAAIELAISTLRAAADERLQDRS